jgi:hypothetical protein
MRKIEIPSPVQFHDPFTGTPKETMDFGAFLLCLMGNPLWLEGYAQAKAQDNVLRSYALACDTNETTMQVSDEDFIFLERASREPKMMHIGPLGPQVMAGFGKHPAMARQFLPLQEAIINASKVR